MAKVERKPLAWVEIDPATLSEAEQAAYQAYKLAYKVMKEKRDAFEASMQTRAPQGKVLKFGYNFGKLSVALDDKPVTATTKAQGRQSLEAWLAQQAQ